MADVVFTFSYVTWEVACRRGWFMPDDRLARTLLDHEGVDRLLVCHQFRSRPRQFLSQRLRIAEEPFPADERRHLVEPLRLRRSDSRRPSIVARAYAAYDRKLRLAAEQHGLEDPVVITAHPLAAGFSDFDWAREVTFYATDDWAAHPGYRRWATAYRESYARVRERRRRVCAVSRQVLDGIEPTGPTAVVPNGVDPAEWMGSAAGRQGPPQLVYVGTLDSRLDVAALLSAAEALPHARIVLVGPAAEPRHLAPLRAADNIEVRPPLPRAGVTELIRSADVGLVPHVRSALTRAMSPLKLYEYLAGGVPVAAIDLPPLRDVDERVMLAEGPADFASAVRAALALGRAPEDQRLAFVRANSWSARHKHLLDFALAQ